MSDLDSDLSPAAAGGIVTVGNFDGVHRGHQRMLQTLRDVAAARASHSVVVTFHPHPITVLRPAAVLHRLTTPERRTDLLRRYGADHVVVLPVTMELLQREPEDFLQSVLIDQLHASGIVEGPNFHFGRNRSGDVRLLRKFCEQRGMAFQVIDSVNDSEEMISSSRIRDLLIAGRVAEAVRLLGHPHQLRGRVSRGAGRGRGLGFPTANLVDTEVLLPAHGVYAAACRVDGVSYPAAVNIGPNPTFEDSAVKVECHIDGLTQDLYDRTLTVDLLTEIRALNTFATAEELTHQIRRDVDACRRIFRDADRLSSSEH
ncbi:MAG: bifunctional riboflavin kinase/FAD synthetase [Planctomycetaceae bacterium]